MALLIDPKYHTDNHGYTEQPDDAFILHNVIVHDPEMSVRDGYVTRDFLLTIANQEEMWRETEQGATFCKENETYGFRLIEVSPKKNYEFEVQFVIYREPTETPTWTRHFYINEKGMTDFSPTFADYYPYNSDIEDSDNDN